MAIRILECRRFSASYTNVAARTVKDYEIDLEIGQQRFVILDGSAFPIQRGNVCIRKPGQTVAGRGGQNTILLTVDFSDSQPAARYSRNIPGPLQPLCDSPLLENFCTTDNTNRRLQVIILSLAALSPCLAFLISSSFSFSDITGSFEVSIPQISTLL